MKTDALIEELADSPGLPFAITALQAVMDTERPLRQKFYDEITEDGKIEFINGKVIVQSPAKLRHIQISGNLVSLLRAFVQRHQLGIVTHEKALISLTRNDYEPDLCFFAGEKALHLKPDQLQFPAPDWVCEIISESTERIDRGIKYEDYALHGIKEYWIVQPEKEEVEIHLLDGKIYRLAETVKQGAIQSRAIPGFEIPVRALFDSAVVNEALAQLLG